MKQPLSFLVCSVTCVALACVVIGLTGCEEAKGLSGLTLDPSSATLTPDSLTLTITVTSSSATNNDLALPIAWSVADASLGSVTHNGGVTAVYRSSGAIGVNVVIARDQYDNEGFTTIRQSASTYSIVLTASPGTTIEVGTAATISIDGTDATGPFTWRLLTGPGAVTGGTGSRSAVYSSSVTGTGVIQVTDGNGVQGTVAIVVQDSSTGGGGGSGGPGGS